MKKELLEKIGKLHEAEKYQEIIDLIEALPAERLNTELIGQLARAYNNVENYAKGLELLKSIEFEEGNSFQWNWRAGFSYFFLEDYINAKKHFLKAYELDPDDEDVCDFLIGVYLSLAKIEDEKGNSEKALEYALESRKYSYDEKGIMEADSFLAWLYNKYKEYTKAEEILRKQLARNKDDKWTLSELAYSLSGQGKYEEAIEKFEYVLSLEVEDEGNLEFIYSQLGWCYRQLEDYEKALEYYLKGYEKDNRFKEDTYLLSDIGWLYDRFGKYENGEKFLSKAYELGERNRWIHMELGECLTRLGRYEEAIKKLLKSRELYIEEGKLPYSEDLELAFCYAALKDKEKAEEHMKLSLDALGAYAESEEYLKKRFTEIREMINSISNSPQFFSKFKKFFS